MAKWKLPEVEPMTDETEAPVTVFSDHAPEAVILALEDQVDALEDQVDAKDKRIAELENLVEKLGQSLHLSEVAYQYRTSCHRGNASLNI